MSALRRRPRWRRAAWIALALAGLAVTAALAIAASHLTVERVGLAGQSSAVGAQLAPATPARPGASAKPPAPTAPQAKGEGADD